ncbi:hypothetical protein F1559_000829 [Cyanidiococcus yangmingshanensis]|uniref:Uncharacterized protein n=1 Tax=Cyanidiococcus yangmingshanensis TaxID=2690220 RepID=A0A7J7IEX8_9RHOD|nr:hypothetical protein F1559_000829 [Cyanidiococcus yangmingshanensis]
MARSTPIPESDLAWARVTGHQRAGAHCWLSAACTGPCRNASVRSRDAPTWRLERSPIAVVRARLFSTGAISRRLNERSERWPWRPLATNDESIRVLPSATDTPLMGNRSALMVHVSSFPMRRQIGSFKENLFLHRGRSKTLQGLWTKPGQYAGRLTQRVRMASSRPGRYSLRFIDRADEIRLLQAVTLSRRDHGSLAAEVLQLPTMRRVYWTGLFMTPALWIGALCLLIVGLFWKIQLRIGRVYVVPEQVALMWRSDRAGPVTAERARQWPTSSSRSELAIFWARLRYMVEAWLRRLDQQYERASLKAPRRWFADVSDLYESIMNRMQLSIEETRRIFTLLSREEHLQMARERPDHQASKLDHAADTLLSSRQEALTAARGLCASASSSSTLNGSARAALAQLLLPHMPRLDQYVSSQRKERKSSANDSGPAIVGLVFSNAMIPHIMLGAAVVAAAAGARVCLVDDWRSTLSTIYAPFLLGVGLNPFPTLAESSAMFDRFHVALYRSPIGLATRDIRLLLERRVGSSDATPSPVALGDLVGPLLNAYDFDRLVLAPGLHASSASNELDAMTDAVAFFRPTRAWLLSCLLQSETDCDGHVADQHLGCLLPWGRNCVRQVAYRGPNDQGEDIAEVEEIPLQPHRYQMYSEGYLSDVIGADAAANARILHEALTGVNLSNSGSLSSASDNPGVERLESLREIITLNAATILLASGLVQTVHEGVQAARQVMMVPSVLGRRGAPHVPSDAAALWYRLRHISR